MIFVSEGVLVVVMTYQKAGIHEFRLDEKSENLSHSHRDIAVSQVLLYSDTMLSIHVIRTINEACARRTNQAFQVINPVESKFVPNVGPNMMRARSPIFTELSSWILSWDGSKRGPRLSKVKIRCSCGCHHELSMGANRIMLKLDMTHP